MNKCYKNALLKGSRAFFIKLKLSVLDFIDKGPKLESDLKDALRVFLKIYRDKVENNALVFKDGGRI